MSDESSVWNQVLDAYRDIEVAKRSQPQLVQGAQQIQVPFSQNVSAPNEPVAATNSGAISSIASNSMMPMYLIGGGLLLLTVALVARKARK